jgi:hypothetical protein
MSIRRAASIGGLLTAILTSIIAAFGTPALAAPVIPNGTPIELTFPAGEVCAFPVQITGVTGQKTPDNNQGGVLATGPFTATVTNGSTGASETFNASGPTLLDPQNGMTVMTGPSIIVQPASAGLGAPFLIYERGRVVFNPPNQQGFGSINSITGTTVDICAALT